MSESRGRPREGPSSLPIYDSMEQCSAATGIPLKVIKAAKRAGSDAFKSNRVYLDRLLHWIFTNEEAADEVANWNEALAKEKTLRERIKRHKDEETVADRPTIKYGAAKIMSLIFDTLERLFCYELPGANVGKSEAEMAASAKAVISQLRTRLAEDIENLGISHE